MVANLAAEARTIELDGERVRPDLQVVLAFDTDGITLDATMLAVPPESAVVLGPAR